MNYNYKQFMLIALGMASMHKGFLPAMRKTKRCVNPRCKKKQYQARIVV